MVDDPPPDRAEREREAELRAMTIGDPQRVDGPVTLAEPDPGWPALFAREERRIRGALGDGALLVEHAGSTSVPGLAAKPIIDVVLVVADSADESSYVPALEAAGYSLRIRTPAWDEHRMLKGDDPEVNLHVFSQGSLEVERMLRFRARLRAQPGEPARYEAAKRELAARRWTYVQDYADAKSAVIEDIVARAQG